MNAATTERTTYEVWLDGDIVSTHRSIKAAVSMAKKSSGATVIECRRGCETILRRDINSSGAWIVCIA